MKKTSLHVAAAAVMPMLALGAGGFQRAGGRRRHQPWAGDHHPAAHHHRVVPVKGDFDGDGHDDVFLARYVPGSGTDYLVERASRDDTSGTTIADRFDVTTSRISGQYIPVVVVTSTAMTVADDTSSGTAGQRPDSIWYFTGRGTVVGQSLWGRSAGTTRPWSVTSSTPPTASGKRTTSSGGQQLVLTCGRATPTRRLRRRTSTIRPTTPRFDKRRQLLPVGRRPLVRRSTWTFLFYVAGNLHRRIGSGRATATAGSSPAVTINGDYNPIIGNFDANTPGVDMTDIFWYGPGSGADSVWMNNGKTFTTRAATVNGYYSPMVVLSRESTTQTTSSGT
ncbi:MAG: hypothetical protein U0P45_02950 [Acidimicrobiales bacterium]